MTGGDILVECLKAQGVRCVFGMPGTQNIQIYDSLLRHGAGVIDSIHGAGPEIHRLVSLIVSGAAPPRPAFPARACYTMRRHPAAS